MGWPSAASTSEVTDQSASSNDSTVAPCCHSYVAADGGVTAPTNRTAPSSDIRDFRSSSAQKTPGSVDGTDATALSRAPLMRHLPRQRDDLLLEPAHPLVQILPHGGDVHVFRSHVFA